MSRKLEPVALAVALAALAISPAAGAAEVLGGPATGHRPAVARDSLAGRAAFVPGETIVRFERGATAGDRRAARDAAGVGFDRALSVARTQVVEVEGGVAAAVERLERQPDVAYAQPNYRYQALAVAPPDDTFFGDLWGLQDPAPPNPGVDALEAWQQTRGAGQVIAVVDTGVALDHPDIQGNLWTGPGGVHGHDFVDGDGDPDDFHFHGTHVAGTAAAIDANGLGVAGVAPDAQIMAVRVLDGDGSGSTDDIADGIVFAVQNGADVINLSLGGPAGAGDQAMSDAVALANQANAVVVAAAGNDGADNDVAPTAPCTLPGPNLICVAAVTQSGALASFSNRGAATVDVGAPGTNVLSAKTDYGAIGVEDFDSGLAAWDTFAAPGSSTWATTTSSSSSGTHSVTDSPGGNYVNDADSELVTAGALNLMGERGCRIDVDLRYEIQDQAANGALFDFLFVGAVTNDPALFDGLPFAGESSGYDSGNFRREEISISDLGGRSDVFPFLGLFADGSVRRDGAYADDLEVRCRRATYVDSKTAAGNYTAFNGTSMAAPHVAGVAALVRAADPGAPAAQVVQAIKDGGTPLGSLDEGATVTGRTADADGAIAAALGVPNPVPPPVAPPRAAARPLPSVILPGARTSVRVSRSGAFRYAFRATPSLAGAIGFRTRGKVNVARRTHLTLGRKRFKTAATGRVVVRVKLSRRQLRILRANRRFLLRVTATVHDSTGASARATGRLTLKPPTR